MTKAKRSSIRVFALSADDQGRLFVADDMLGPPSKRTTANQQVQGLQDRGFPSAVGSDEEIHPVIQIYAQRPDIAHVR